MARRPGFVPTARRGLTSREPAARTPATGRAPATRVAPVSRHAPTTARAATSVHRQVPAPRRRRSATPARAPANAAQAIVSTVCAATPPARRVARAVPCQDRWVPARVTQRRPTRRTPAASTSATEAGPASRPAPAEPARPRARRQPTATQGRVRPTSSTPIPAPTRASAHQAPATRSTSIPTVTCTVPELRHRSVEPPGRPTGAPWAATAARPM